MRTERRLSWAAALALGVSGLVAGKLWGQVPDPPKPMYSFLPAEYAQPYLPTFAEWQALRITALGASTTRVSEHFNRQHLTCFVTQKGLVMTLDLAPVGGWNLHQGGGKFTGPLPKVKADLQKGIDQSLSFVENFFPEVKRDVMTVRVYLQSESVGEVVGGVFRLNSEKADKTAEPAKG